MIISTITALLVLICVSSNKYIILGPIRGGGPSVLIRKTSSPSVSLIDTFAGRVTALQVSDYSQRGCKR